MINLKEIPKKPGIYKLKNLINGKIYIGKSINLRDRIQDYHKNRKKLTSPITLAINKYGIKNFEAELIEEFDSIDNLELLALETAYILYFNSINKEIGYNVCLCAYDRTGTKNSPEQIENHRQKLLGRNIPKNTVWLLVAVIWVEFAHRKLV